MTLSAAEQYLLELINRARLDPVAEAERQGIDLNAGLAPGTIAATPLQVLATQGDLEDAAVAHSEWILATDTFSHTGAGGSNPGDRMRAEGYTFNGHWGWAENLAFYASSQAFDLASVIETHHNGLYASAGHRTNIFSANMDEIGIGQVAGTYTQNGNDLHASVLTQNFAFSGGQTFVTGVAYSDGNGDGFYSMGEGLSGITIRVGSASDATATAGGYSVLANAGANVAVSVTHGATGQTDLTMDLRAGNGKLDIVQAPDGSWGLALSASANLLGGIADATLLGVGNLNLGGSAADNVLTGNRGNNTIQGRDGNDTVSGAAGHDTLNGGSGNDLVLGGTGNDDLSDGWGIDTLTGGAGGDLFILTADGATDTITDFTPGTDRIDLSAWGTVPGTPTLVQTGFGMTITQGSEVLHVYGSTGGPINPATLGAAVIITPPAITDPVPPPPPPATTLVGTAQNEVLTGTGNADLIEGMAGHDTLLGGADNDTLDGGLGNDILIGGTGADDMRGGLGNDRYIVDDAGDVITGEIGFSQGGGIDTVESWISFTLPANVEILRLMGSADINGTGGAAPEALVGNSGNNVLSGGGGNDVITAKDGNDILIGGGGRDYLVGNAGADVFVFTAVSDSRPGTANRDFINGFVHGEDLIDLSDIDANSLTGADDAFSFIGNAAFSGTAGELRFFTFGGGNFNIVEADVDGDGVADMQIFVNLTNFMTNSDFLL